MKSCGKNLIFLVILIFSFFSHAEKPEFGISLLTSKNENTPYEKEIEGVLLIDYQGHSLGFEESEKYALEILPTGLKLNLNGEEQEIYTDVASFHKISKKNKNRFLDLNIISYDQEKNSHKSMSNYSQANLLDLKATTYLNIGSIDIGLKGSLQLGGNISGEIQKDNQVLTIKDRKMRSGQVALSLQYELPFNYIELYVHGSIGKERGKNTFSRTESLTFETRGIPFLRKVSAVPYLKYQERKFKFYDESFKAPKDSLWLLGVDFYYTD